MSYDIDLVDENGNRYQLDAPHHEGGTQPVCGWTETHINITWNYSWFYYHFLDHENGIRWLYGRKASDCLPRLKACLLEFGTPFGSQARGGPLETYAFQLHDPDQDADRMVREVP